MAQEYKVGMIFHLANGWRVKLNEQLSPETWEVLNWGESSNIWWGDSHAYNISEFTKQITEDDLNWLHVNDNRVRHVWLDTDTNIEFVVSPDFYAASGVPICVESGKDCEYLRTEISHSMDHDDY